MDEGGRRDRYLEDGFVVVPAFLTSLDLAPAVDELPRLFPTADELHDDVDPARNRRFRDEFAGITNFPFPSLQLNLLAVHRRLIALAEELLGSSDLRVYSIEAWAKYTGAATYDQPHHRDYLNHSLLVPSPSADPSQVEMFLYLADVPPSLGPPRFVPLPRTADLPAIPNWYHRTPEPAPDDHASWHAPGGWPDLYEQEVSGAGPAGTVATYRIETFHRGTELTEPRGARYTIHVNFRRADTDWIGRRSWTDKVGGPDWTPFVCHASPRQLELFGFPPPGHPYWTPATLEGLALRYPGIDVTPWTPSTPPP